LRARPQRSGSFPQAQHLRSARDFAAVKAHGRRWDAGLFVAQLHWRAPEAPAGTATASRRVGFIASRQVGNSPARQRAKRLLREAWRWERDALPEGVDLVLVARRGLPDSTSTEIRRRLQRAFTELVRRGPRPPPAAEPSATAP